MYSRNKQRKNPTSFKDHPNALSRPDFTIHVRTFSPHTTRIVLRPSIDMQLINFQPQHHKENLYIL